MCGEVAIRRITVAGPRARRSGRPYTAERPPGKSPHASRAGMSPIIITSIPAGVRPEVAAGRQVVELGLGGQGGLAGGSTAWWRRSPSRSAAEARKLLRQSQHQQGRRKRRKRLSTIAGAHLFSLRG